MKEKLKAQNGITLVALVITIIVMLVLVGVILVASVAENGIIDRATTALVENERAEIQEIINVSMIFKPTAAESSNSYLNMSATAEAIVKNLNEAGYKVLKASGEGYATRGTDIYTEGEDSFNLNIKGKRASYKGVIEQNGLVEDIEPIEEKNESNNPNNNNNNNNNNQEAVIPGKPPVSVTSDLELLRAYFLGEVDEANGTRLGKDITDVVDISCFNFKNDENIKDAEVSLRLAGLEGDLDDGPLSMYIRYNRVKYAITIMEDTSRGGSGLFTTGDVVVANTPDLASNVGKEVIFDNKNWIVLYDDNINGTQIISADILEVNNVTLGNNDTHINWTDSQVISDADTIVKDGTLSDLEKSIYSYNNAIDTLNNVCTSLVNPNESVIKSVRSVGTNPTNPKDSSKMLKKSEVPNYTGTWFDLYDEKIKCEDNNYITDYETMYTIGIDGSGIAQGYWLGSRLHTNPFSSSNDWGYFGLRVINNNAGFDDRFFIIRENNVNPVSVDTSYGVRPVITLKEDILNSATGTGTVQDPLIIN